MMMTMAFFAAAVVVVAAAAAAADDDDDDDADAADADANTDAATDDDEDDDDDVDDDEDDVYLSIYVISIYQKYEYLCWLSCLYFLLHLSYHTVHANQISNTDTGNTGAVGFLSLIIWWRNCVQNIKTFPEDINWIMWIELWCYGLSIQSIKQPC